MADDIKVAKWSSFTPAELLCSVLVEVGSSRAKSGEFIDLPFYVHLSESLQISSTSSRAELGAFDPGR